MDSVNKYFDFKCFQKIERRSQKLFIAVSISAVYHCWVLKSKKEILFKKTLNLPLNH